MMRHSRPRLDNERWGCGETSSKCACDNGPVEKGHEQNRWIEECLQCVQESLTTFLEAVAGVEGEVGLPGSRGVIHVCIIARDTILRRDHVSTDQHFPDEEDLLISDRVRYHRVSGMKKKTPTKKNEAAIAVAW